MCSSDLEVSIHPGDDKDIRFKNMLSNLGFNIVKKYDGFRDYSELKDKIEQNAEGFVVRFSNGDRMKVKGEEYLRLHKIMTNISTTGVWEHLSSGGDINELLKDVPDEFYKKVKEQSTVNYNDGKDVNLTRQQLIDIVVNLKKNISLEKINGIFLKTKFGIISLN